MAMALAATTPASHSEPLLPRKSRATESLSSSDASSSSGDDAAAERPPWGPRFLGTHLAVASAALLALAGVAASGVAAAAAPTALVFVMGGVCLLNAPTVLVRQLCIAKNVGECNTTHSRMLPV